MTDLGLFLLDGISQFGEGLLVTVEVRLALVVNDGNLLLRRRSRDFLCSFYKAYLFRYPVFTTATVHLRVGPALTAGTTTAANNAANKIFFILAVF